MARAKSKPISPDNPQARIEEHPAFLPRSIRFWWLLRQVPASP
ncbi:hypothetical protein PSE10C_57830 [Pseudomonas amygdali pv. eriobotryae]|nr:hypothetical protein PSE10C_57830 [Pseudomonas amygdali pv. eriobotryae]